MNVILFRNGNFTRFVLATAATVLATGFLQTSLSLFMLDLTGSAGKFGLSLLIGQLPNLLVGLFAGALVDRLDRRRLMAQLSWVRAALLLAVFTYGLFHPVSEGTIYCLTALLGLCQTLIGPAEVAMIPAIVSKEQLVDANTLNGTLVESITVAGPVLAAMLYSATGIQTNLLFCSALFAVSAAALGFVYVPRQSRPDRRLSVLTDIAAGLSLFKRELRLASLVFNGFLTHTFLLPLFLMGFPYMIKQIFHGSNIEVGLVESAATLGSISSVFLVAALRKRVTVSQGILCGICGMILAVLPMGLLGHQVVLDMLGVRSLHVVLFFGFIALLLFWMFGLYGVFYMTFYQRTVPPEMLGRYFAVQALVFGTGRMLGFQMYGYLLDHFAPSLAVAVLAVGMVAKLLVHIPFMRLDRVSQAAER